MFGSLLLVWLAAITAPGPDTVQLTRMALRGRAQAVWAAVGIMLGNTIWITASLLGLSALIAARPHLITALEIIGACVLLWMGVGAIRAALAMRAAGAGADTSSVAGGSDGYLPTGVLQALRIGLVTNLSNPKAMIFFAAVFAQFVTPTMGVKAALLLLVTGLVWFVSFALAARWAAHILQRYAASIELVSGLIFSGVAIALLVNALQG